MTSTIPDLAGEWREWHARRERELAALHGWLSITALHRLTEQPGEFPDVPGRWSATEDGVVLTASAADELVVPTVREARLIDGTVRLHPVDGRPGTMVGAGRRTIEVVRRGAVHALRVRDPEAPARAAFTGVPAFPVDARWLVPALFVPYPQPRRCTVDASLGDAHGIPCVRTAVGEVRLEIDGREHSLVAFAGTDDALVLHFRDRTSGVSTFAGGRELVVPRPVGPVLTVDLNRVINPPWAFTPFATRTEVPPGNVLDVAVEAGERV
ncbi:hypothetical protein SAMN05443637_1326 [Pseudonocardia thermophila]|uniref:DUF1684 domain-containing protein n=1 Tax=Pseudonocardia thermophila TaxID=1848 RepID=A0A1M7B2T8_PSETH|nr:DUF1684 domain-containing protein [Pseudonocardia thermophila]SHL49338.1 hypothetical protein SAMN05443637_1326 [Pseudonocardia thermophila]